MALSKKPTPTRFGNTARAFAILIAASASLTMAASHALGDGPSPVDTSLCDTLGEGYSLLGTIKPRHAREIQSSNWSVGAETMDRDYTVYENWKPYLGPLGIKKARLQSGWAKTEKVRGEYDWAWLDEIVLDMVDQGVEPWVCFCYGNPIYPGGGDIGLGGGLPKSDEALLAWERYVKATVARYKEHVDEWEVWNEPGLRGANAAEDYTSFLVRTADAIRSEQPDACVIAFGMAGIKHGWVEDILSRVQAMGKLHLIDQVTYHPYSYNPSDSYTAVARLRELVKRFSDTMSIRQGENGAPSKRGSYGALSDYDWTEKNQAKWALRRLLGDLGHDIPSSYFSICDMQYPTRRNFKGLLAIHDDKSVAYVKPAYFAIQNLTAIFDDRLQRCHDFDASVEGDAGRYSVFAYRDHNGDPIVTSWRSSDRPGQRPDIKTVVVRLPNIRFEQPVWIDLLSGTVHEIDDSLWTFKNDTTTLLALAVYDSPVVIAERAAITDVLRLDNREKGAAHPIRLLSPRRSHRRVGPRL